MKNNKTTILLVIIAALAGWNIFTTSQIKTNVAEYNKKIDIIQKEVDSVYTVNKQIDLQIDSVDNNIATVQKSVKNVTNEINIIKNNTNEEVNTIATIGNAELEQLFAARYK